MILKEFAPTALVNAIESNLYAWIPVFGLLGRVVEDDPPGVKRAVCNIPVSLFNSIMDTHLDERTVDQAVKTIVEDARQRKIPVLWWIGPSTQPANIGSTLDENGFNLDDDSPGMAVCLDELNEDLPIPQGVSIRAAGDDASRRDWCQVLPIGFDATGEVAKFVSEAWYTFVSKLDPGVATLYTAYLNGAPVATSLLFLGAGVAGIYAVGTIPGARRKGIGARVTLQPLLDARLRGYKLGILQSSEMGFNVYRSIGFKEYCRVQSYVYRP